jgi:hypothetical protein
VIENAGVTEYSPDGSLWLYRPYCDPVCLQVAPLPERRRCDLALEAALFKLRFGRTVAYRLWWLGIALAVIDADWENAC